MRYLLCILILPLLAACSGVGDSAGADNATGTLETATPASAVAVNGTEPDAPSATATSVASDSPASTAAPDPPAPTSEPAPTSAADDYARHGYHHFEQPEVALMVHPRLSEEATDPPTGEATLYSFVDLNSPYLRLDVDILKGVGPLSEISDGYIRDHIAALVESAPHITGYDIFDSQATTMTNRPGHIARFNFTSDGAPAYGAVLLFSHGDWLYRFIVYGDSHEYPTIEEIIRSIYATGVLRGPA
jgi:hypothetical protein